MIVTATPEDGIITSVALYSINWHIRPPNVACASILSLYRSHRTVPKSDHN